jgi:O-antigen ligase
MLAARQREAALYALAVAAAVAAGATLAQQPQAVPAFALAVCVVALLAALGSAAIAPLAVGAILALSATADIFGRIDLGPTSAYAWVTAGILAAILTVLVTRPRIALDQAARQACLFVFLFPGYALAAAAWHPLGIAGAQNLMVYVGFALLFVFALRAATAGELTPAFMRNALFVTYLGAAVLYTGSLLLDGLGGGAILGSRSFALFALIGIAWSAAYARHGYRREGFLAVALLLLVLLSLSRLAFAAGLLVAVLAALDFSSAVRTNRTLLLLAACAIAAYGAVAVFSPFSERFTQGDVVVISGIKLNVEGRQDLWKVTWSSAQDGLWFGQGAGSTEQAIEEATGTVDHPHNDYLRIIHDFGLAGLALFAAALLSLLALSWRRLRAARVREERALHLSALLGLVAFCVAMATDNPVVYLFVVAPVALLLGTSAGVVPDEPEPEE